MNRTYVRKLSVLFRVCLLAITLACSRLWRSPNLLSFVENALRAFSTKLNKLFARRSPEGVYGVEQALRACSTPYTPLFARRGRASTRRERATTLRIRHALTVVALLAVSLSVLSIEFIVHARPDVGTPLRAGMC